ncbi:MAG: DUF4143 domain-containing protein [Candidatus Pacebacteria bacterium]|nr:DUF4143 domain-containing protein [Candidatus Paceibacterota bacterium]
MDSLVSYLISNFCQILNLSEISKITDVKNYRTLKKYFDYLEKSYICAFLYEFNFKPSKSISSKQKVYFYDNSFLMYKNLFNSENTGFFFENLVFTELLKKGIVPNYDFFYYRTKGGYEVDFIIKQGVKVTALVQVCYDIFNTKTENREIRSLIKASEELSCHNLFVITKNIAKKVEKDGMVVKFIPFDSFYQEAFKF